MTTNQEPCWYCNDEPVVSDCCPMPCPACADRARIRELELELAERDNMLEQLRDANAKLLAENKAIWDRVTDKDSANPTLLKKD